MTPVSNQVINLGTEVGEKIQQARVNRQLNDLNLRVYLLENLVKFLDPDHIYVYSEEYGAFIREKRE